MQDVLGHQLQGSRSGLQLIAERVDQFCPLELPLFVTEAGVHPGPDVLQDVPVGRWGQWCAIFRA